MNIRKRNNAFVFPCRTNEILQGGRPSSAAVYRARKDLRQESQPTSSEEKEARDPSPDVEARQDFWSVTGDYIFRYHVAPRTKLCVLKVDFPILVSYMDVQRQTKTSIVDDYWNTDGDRLLSEPWIGVTRFALPNNNPPEGFL